MISSADSSTSFTCIAIDIFIAKGLVLVLDRNALSKRVTKRVPRQITDRLTLA